MISELDEPLWAVISERGAEASGLKHQVALDLLRQLTQEKVPGLCIVTAVAAQRFNTAATSIPNQARTSSSTHREA